MWACQNGHQDVVKTLLEHSDSIDYNAISGRCKKWTAFVIACKNGHREVVKLLLDYANSKNIQVNGVEALSWTLTVLSDVRRFQPYGAGDGHVSVIKLLLDQNISKFVIFLIHRHLSVPGHRHFSVLDFISSQS